MTCAQIQADLSLYLYGELDFATEEMIEAHLADCAFCQLALNREKQWHAAVNKQQQDVRPEWLGACRRGLLEQISKEPTTAAQTRQRFAGWLRSFLDVRFTERSYRMAGVSFLLLTGFAAGRFFNAHAGPGQSSFLAAGLLQPTTTQVQEIRPESGNRVQITLHQIQVRQISGSRDDDGMIALLVGAARNSQDPGVRIDSVEMLAGQEGLEIRNALANSIRNDPNAAVRAKAIESLRRFPVDAISRGAFEFALAHDSDPGVRAVAIDGLIPAEGNLEVTPQLIDIMSNVMRAPDTDDYVRGRCAQVLNHRSSSNDIY